MDIQRLTPPTIALLAFFALGACASSPEVPEESEESAPEYRSTSTVENSEGSSSNASSESKGDIPASARSGAQGGGGDANQSSKEIPKATGPIAHVDGEPLPAEAFNEEIQKVADSQKFPPAVLHQFKDRLIDRLIDQRLVDDAIAEASIEVSDSEIDDKIDEVRSEFDEVSNQSDREVPSLEQAAKEYGISGDELRDSIRRSIAIEKLMVENGLELPGQDEVEEFYSNNKQKFKQPEQVRARHILAKVDPGANDEEWSKAEKRIKELREEALSDGTDFAELAEEHSDGPSAENGGDIGFVGQGDFDENFTEAAFDLEKGEISEPVRTKYGWHIIELVERRDPRVVPLEEIRDRLHKQLKNQKIRSELQNYIDQLRESAKIEKHPDNIE